MSLRPFRNIDRKKTKVINVGDVKIGGNNPISVQSMTNTLTTDIKATINQINAIHEEGADIVRVSCPDEDSTNALKEITQNVKLPVVADIHFHYKRAIEAAENGAKCLRINPGNIGDKQKIHDILSAAKNNDCSIRIGVNAGSLEKDILEKYKEPCPEALVESALRNIKILEDQNFFNLKVSVKSSDVFLSIAAYRQLSKAMDYPLHLGITEAGSFVSGSIKSSIGLGTLLLDGIGDTIRISLSDDPVKEIKIGNEILKSLGLRNRGVKIISCPSCARQAFQVIETVKVLEEKLSHIKTPVTLSIIGCVVNGPGEAAMTDVGITGGGKGNNMLYLSGVQSKKVLTNDIIDKVVTEVEKKSFRTRKKIMIPSKTIEELIIKHSTLEKDLSSGEIDKKLFAEKSKEYSDVNEIIENARKYLSYEDDKKDLEKILNDSSADKELKDMAELELLDLKTKFEINEKKLKLFLLPKDEADKKNAIIEIRAGTGGLEASLFASDLFKMYEKVSHKKKWTLELISISRSDAGGLKEVIASIKGTNIYSTLKYESGVHRVQRVPDTETQGRVHTSAATVAVLPEAEEVDLKINESDLRIDVFRAGGPGGQSVNTTDSAVRITHIPTGLSVSQQDEKSQHKNKAKGMKILRSRLYELERSRIDEERSNDRKTKIGTGDRSERIRTYNFPQGRVTDHRINLTLHRLEEFLEGEAFDEMIESLTLQAQEDSLSSLN